MMIYLLFVERTPSTNKQIFYIYKCKWKEKKNTCNKKNKRKRKLFNNQLANIILQKNFSGKSYDNIVTTLKLDYDLKISKTAIIQKRTLNPDILSKLNELLLTYIYNDNKPRIIAVDGSQVNLPKELHNSGFKLSDNKGYSVGYLSGLLDIEKNIPINYNLVKHPNERIALIEQLDYVKKNDILVLDRGYYSAELVNILEEKEINYVFRLKRPMNIIEEIESLKKDNQI